MSFCVPLCPDFGFAKPLSFNGMSTRCGTKGYYAPEIVLKQPFFGVAVDIWSLGVVLYALLTTQYPFAPTTNLVSS